MISRTFDAQFLNEVANDPEVRPFLGGEGPLDLTPLVSDPKNVALVTEHGGWVLHYILAGTYELHTLFRPEGRGEPYFAAAKEALRFMFCSTDCLEIVTKCPDDNPGARMAAVKVGFRERAHRDNVWNGDGGISYLGFTLDDWLKRDDEIEDDGASLLCMAEQELGVETPLDDDPWLNRLTGAVVHMIRGKQTPKAIAVFNRCAAIYGYSEIVALRADVIDLGGILVVVKPEGVGVLATS